jgi:hypothetical protein
MDNPSNKRLRDLQGNRCYLCGEAFVVIPRGTPDRRRLNRESMMTADHVRPRVSGATLLANKLLAHARCNTLKSGRQPHPCELIYLAAITAMIAGRYSRRVRIASLAA